MTLTEFLLARIAEEEQAGRPHWDSCRLVRWAPEPAECDCHQPARGIAECEAKRRIVETHRQVPVPLVAAVCPRCRAEHEAAPSVVMCGHCGSPCHFDDYLGPLLALPYADHSDYRAEWRP